MKTWELTKQQKEDLQVLRSPQGYRADYAYEAAFRVLADTFEMVRFMNLRFYGEDGLDK